MLVGAFREDAADHERFKSALDRDVLSELSWGYSTLILSGFIRIVTNRRIFNTPTPPGEAVAFAESLASQPNAIELRPGDRHWTIFSRLCLDTNASGNLVPDAYYASLAIEAGAEFVTADADFALFPGLRWVHPFNMS